MRDEGFTLSAHYVRLIADQVRNRGVDIRTWLAASGLRERQLLDPSLTVSVPTFRRLVSDALALAREPALGLIVGERLLASTHGILGYAVMNSGSLRQALDLFERYVPLRIALVAIAHDVHRGELRVRFRETVPLGDIHRPVMEATVLSTKNVCDTLATGASVGRVSFAFATPGYAELARQLFKTDVRWGQSWTGFTLPLDVVDRPLAMSDPAAFEEAARICQRELDKLTGNESVATRVRRVLLESQNGFPSLQTTARLMRLTPRTLHRRLVDDGTSFKQLLDELRHTLAIENLKAGRRSVQEIAYALGYTDVANFRRAFKRWAGTSPSAYREQLSSRRTG